MSYNQNDLNAHKSNGIGMGLMIGCVLVLAVICGFGYITTQNTDLAHTAINESHRAQDIQATTIVYEREQKAIAQATAAAYTMPQTIQDAKLVDSVNDGIVRIVGIMAGALLAVLVFLFVQWARNS